MQMRHSRRLSVFINSEPLELQLNCNCHLQLEIDIDKFLAKLFLEVARNLKIAT